MKNNFHSLDDLPSIEHIYSRKQRNQNSQIWGCGKRKLSREQAKEILRSASRTRAIHAKNGASISSRREIRAYLCDRCVPVVWHTTSKSLARSSSIGVQNESAA